MVKERKKYKPKKHTKKNKNNPVVKFAEQQFMALRQNKKYEKSLEYLDLFVKENEHWKFNKNLQGYILRNILLKPLYNKEYFNTFLKYFKNMNEKSKKDFLEICVNKIDQYNNKKLNLFDTPLKFKDLEKEEKIKLRYYKRCVMLVENF